MKAKITDAELVGYLRAVRDNGGNISGTARALDMNRQQLNSYVLMAKDRGLTADTPVMDREAKLEIALKQAQRDLKALVKENDSAERIRTEVFNLASRDPEPPAWIEKPRKGSTNRGVPMTMWSDWHWGEVVNPEEVAGLNEFNTPIAKRRVQRLVDTTISLARNHMGKGDESYPGIIVCLGGDMITGTIHEELAETNDRTTQQSINDLSDVLASALEKMADEFGRVFVPCVVGNHGRSTRKPRMKGRVYTSHEWLIYCNLERYFRNDKRIQFFIPGESDARFKVYGHRFLLTHGDSLGVKGGDGIIGAIGPIMRGSIKVGQSEAQIGRNVDTIIMGHWHQMLWLPGAIVNNCLKGYDEYARLALRAPYSRPSQALWFVHPDHGITAKWEVFLENRRETADHDKWLTWQD
jgi:transposase-like protein